MKPLPKSYIHDQEEREEWLREGGVELLYLMESHRAGEAGDEETAWQWMSHIDLCAEALWSIKACTGGDFIREKGLRTGKADEAYGPDWLNS